MIYLCGNFSLDTRAYVLERDGMNQTLEPQVFDLLHYLIENRDRVVTRDELLDNLWKDRIVSESALNGRLKAARKAVGDNGKQQQIIKTIHRRGYQFIADVSISSDTDAGDLPSVPMQSALFDKPSVAVLPFENLGEAGESDYFANGLTQDINTNLCRYRDLLVIDSQSAFEFREGHSNIENIARDLGVQYLASGSVRLAGNRIRISSKLIEAANGKFVWGERLERAYEDVFDLEDEVAGKIASNLASHIEGEKIAIAGRKSPESMSAYDCVLQARKFEDRYVKEDLEEERKLLEQAIEIDPQYSAAYAHMACSYVRESETEWCDSREAALTQAVDYARKAGSLDEYNSFAHMALGWAYLYQKKFDLAEVCLDRAIDCNPNDYDSYCIKSWLLALTGRGPEVSYCGTRALQLNPLAPDDCLQGIAIAHYTEARYEKALDMLERIRDPNGYSEALRAACFAQLGNEDKANSAAASAFELGGDSIRQRGWLDIFPFKYPRDLEHFVSGLIKADILVD